MFLLPQFFPHIPDLPTHQTLFFFSLFKRNKSFFKKISYKNTKMEIKIIKRLIKQNQEEAKIKQNDRKISLSLFCVD